MQLASLILVLSAFGAAAANVEELIAHSFAQSQTPPQQTAPPQKPPQTPPTAEKPPTPPAGSKPQTPAAEAKPQPAVRPTVTVFVTDRSGQPISSVSVKASGPVERTGSTDVEGTLVFRNVTAGSYRLRFEHGQYVTLDRDITVQAGRPLKTTVALDLAPPPPPPPKPEIVTPPAPPPPPPLPAVEPSAVAIPDFVEKNYIGSAPSKYSSVGCTASATTVLIQLRDPLAEHTHADSDEILYVVAGEGTHRVAGKDMPLAPGSLAIVPRGTTHSVARRGRAPIIVLSTLSGPPCPSLK
jgi:mannose-6-phosphate isomerase-like protein (cupin superfamily)